MSCPSRAEEARVMEGARRGTCHGGDERQLCGQKAGNLVGRWEIWNCAMFRVTGTIGSVGPRLDGVLRDNGGGFSW